jgi:hypothetical protein
MENPNLPPGHTSLKKLGFGDAARFALRNRNIECMGDLRRLGMDGLRAKGVHGYLLVQCERCIERGSPLPLPEEIDPETQYQPGPPPKKAATPKPDPSKSALPPVGDKRKGTKGPRPFHTMVCDQGHETQRKQSPKLYDPCPECGGLVSRKAK